MFALSKMSLSVVAIEAPPLSDPGSLQSVSRQRGFVTRGAALIMPQ
jgi:hypothetical protein